MFQLQEALLQQLSSDRQALRKRSIMALSNLLALSDATLYGETMDVIVQHLTAPGVIHLFLSFSEKISSWEKRHRMIFMNGLLPSLAGISCAISYNGTNMSEYLQNNQSPFRETLIEISPSTGGLYYSN